MTKIKKYGRDKEIRKRQEENKQKTKEQRGIVTVTKFKRNIL